MENVLSRVEKYKEYRKEILEMPDDGFVETRDSKNINVERVVLNNKENQIGISDLLNVHQDFSSTQVDTKNENYEKHLKKRKRYYIFVSILSIILIISIIVLGILSWGFNL
jgi:hypothetical protein